VGDKAGKYWDYRECAWVKCPTPADGVVATRAQGQAATRALGQVVPGQAQPVEPAEVDDPTVVGSSS